MIHLLVWLKQVKFDRRKINAELKLKFLSELVKWIEKTLIEPGKTSKGTTQMFYSSSRQATLTRTTEAG